jgi:hypothetical protein
MPNGQNDVLFGNTVKSDGFCVDFLFYKRAYSQTEDTIENHDVSLEDFTFEEVKQYYRPSFLDPGRKSVYTAAMGLNPQEHSIIRCTIKEYYHLTGSTMYAKKLQQQKDQDGITEIESAIPTAKTTKSDTYLRHVEYMLANSTVLFTFYGRQTRRSRFNLYQGRQRAPEMMVNMLLHGGSKYNRKKRSKRNKAKKKAKKPKKKEKNAMPEEKKKQVSLSCLYLSNV